MVWVIDFVPQNDLESCEYNKTSKILMMKCVLESLLGRYYANERVNNWILVFIFCICNTPKYQLSQTRIYSKVFTWVIMAHPVVVDDELGTSPFFLRSLWLTVNNQNSERHAICCDRQKVFPMTVERCGSPPCHAWWRLCSALWVCQFYEARYRTRCRGYPWAGDHLPYVGRALASANVAALW